ncbi:hypothetical protein LCGC14_1276380 [marine sediment metagenome]|uniref:Macro domain-containing protein n=1 Tax=marine sediment metagenome TaxID=412755 RepID=A0A0F9NZK2_9ZZZZ
MKELKADLWIIPADVTVITTNGFVKNNGHSVMGRGCAKEAMTMYPTIDEYLGKVINASNGSFYAMDLGWWWKRHTESPLAQGHHIVALPVKKHWAHPARLDIILDTINDLVRLVNQQGWKFIVLPRPGCGNGHLDWESQVKPLIKDILDNRFTVVTK